MDRTVILMRHADAQWPEYTGSDFDRPLTPRGEQDARRAGAAIAAIEPRPGLLLASPAARTRHTAQLVAEAFGTPVVPVSHVDALYNAGAASLEAELRRTAMATVGTILLVAHNPGISELARRLSGGAAMASFEPAQWCRLTLAD